MDTLEKKSEIENKSLKYEFDLSVYKRPEQLFNINFKDEWDTACFEYYNENGEFESLED